MQLQENHKEGYVLTSSIDSFMLVELEKLEKMSNSYSYELRYLSKRIRMDLWNKNKNSQQLYKLVKAINDFYYLVGEFTSLEDYINLSVIIEYVNCLQNYSYHYLGINNNAGKYFDDLRSDIQMESAKRIIKKQWNDIYASEDGYKSFLEIFDEIFTNCINRYNDKFFVDMNANDKLCRVVSGIGHDKDRFIPWPAKTNNRWNPPGKQFLYLSYSKEKRKHNEYLTINEYICLKEIRAQKGEAYSFCDFRAKVKGKILDLSYNDVSLSSIKRGVGNYQNNTVSKIVKEILSNPQAKNKYRNRSILKKDIKVKMSRYKEMDKMIIEESFVKQYLKMICNCIYTKVDERDGEAKEKAYKSFHILSAYLESKKVTGIIYPCTRTKKIVGKNIVLFNVNDAFPISTSIREIVYK